MYFLNNSKAQLDDLLARAAEKLQLDKTRKEKMESSYNAIQEFLEKDEYFFNKLEFEIYPQGSIRIGTTVKPLSKNEFDLDIVLHIKNESYERIDPNTVYNALWSRLKRDGVYGEKVEQKTRCIRLNYSGDYHMDILPGCQYSASDNNKIVIPDKKLKTWLTSNPRGYADWFLYKANSVRQTLLEKAYAAENIPSDDFATKKPLQRAVQLIKRYRDLHFEKNQDYATPSIILTTLAGTLYLGQDSIFETIDYIVSQINSQIVISRTKRIKVLNPVNPEEDFTDKWESEPQYYTEFIKFVETLNRNWQDLKKDNGIIEESNILKGILGEQIFNESLKEQTLITEKYRSKGQIFTSNKSGTIGSSNISSNPVKKNTFYGK
jgi:hypothetical protein